MTENYIGTELAQFYESFILFKFNIGQIKEAYDLLEKAN